MPNSTRSNKENQLLFSSDPASLERSIRKGIRSSSIDNNTSLSLDSRPPQSTQTPVSSTDTRSPPSPKDTLPSTDIFHPMSIDTSVQKSIDTKQRDMVATLILVCDEKGDLHNQDGHLRNAAGQRIDAQGAAIPERQSKSLDGLSRASIDDTYGVNRILQCREDSDSRGVRSKTPTSTQPCLSFRILKEISSELTIRGRNEEEAIVRRTCSAVDRYRREASTLEDYDRSMYILYHRSMSRREMRDLVPADFKPKASPNYKITPDDAVDRYRREASTIEDYDRSMYILYHRSMSRREMRDLVPADFKPKASPNYKITPDETAREMLTADLGD
ncbi:hypothetical protein F2Q69_00006507 [Brassica cretica]|uniref:Uncharacterized protein n=1 Tax=Brassica cretica TaxID=69181 RepID=A0A8S9PE01_BRACR|nr:hypothetical protein F2Q69_00006507 [Brassica cretica]